METFLGEGCSLECPSASVSPPAYWAVGGEGVMAAPPGVCRGFSEGQQCLAHSRCSGSREVLGFEAGELGRAQGRARPGVGHHLRPVGVSFRSPPGPRGTLLSIPKRKFALRACTQVPARALAPAELLRTWGSAHSLLGEPLEGPGHGGGRRGARAAPPPVSPSSAGASSPGRPFVCPACGMACGYI
ncbi:unnamed protein product [Rangifer tarandus platyrhynchus]|uniref:Uncharacterized protein n=1 Tax=Rangifer tarandus platyrhynchus TaxID=3082113 RepID=A0ABN8Y277_RANTA|nr:unnamed protein product [Rangifer tarandus platyrhynchus]